MISWPSPNAFLCPSSSASNLIEYGDDIFPELGRIFAHREVSDLLHNRHFHPGDRARGPEGIFRSTGKIVFASEQVKRAKSGVDTRQFATQIGIDPIEIEVTPKNTGTALHVLPKGLMAMLLGTLRSDQPGNQCGANFSPMHVGAMKPARIVPRLLEVGGFEADQGPEFRPMGMRQLKDDPPSDGTPQGHGTLESQRGAESPNRRHVSLGGEPVLPLFPSYREGMTFHARAGRRRSRGSFWSQRHRP